MTTQCERCHQTAECSFYGHAADVDAEQAQNGEWLCGPCVSLRRAELDSAINHLKAFLGESNE